MNTRHLRAEDLAGRRWRGLVRESTQAQADRWSPERQRSDIRRAAERLGMVGDDVWYERVGSGETEGAPELQQALDDAGQYDVLVVFSTSRLARNRAEAVRVKAEFKRLGIVVYFVAENLISGTYAGSISEGVHEVLDEHANEERRLYISGGLRQRQLAGRWVGNVPYGMRRTLVDFPDGTRGWDGAIEPDPDTGPVVRRIFDDYLGGGTTRTVALGLNAEGQRSLTGQPWTAPMIDGVLSNPAYAGRLVRYRRSRPRHYYEQESADGHAIVGAQYEGVVSGVLFDQVAHLRASRSSRPAGQGRGRTYPLSKVLRCVRCGYRMTGLAGANDRYYQCAGRRAYKTCDAPSIRASRAEAAFADWLGSYVLPPDWRTAIAQTNVASFRAGERDRQSGLEERLKRLKNLYAWGDLVEDDYRAQSAELRREMGAIALPRVAGLESAASVLADLGAAWPDASPEVQASIPPLMLKSAEVEDGEVVAWVVDAALRPLLDLCTRRDLTRVSQRVVNREVRYSA